MGSQSTQFIAAIISIAAMVAMFWMSKRGSAQFSTSIQQIGGSSRSKAALTAVLPAAPYRCDLLNSSGSRFVDATTSHGALFNFSTRSIELAQRMANHHLDGTNMTNWRRAFSSARRRSKTPCDPTAPPGNVAACPQATLNIAVFGGSMVAGAGCDGGPSVQESCAYPSMIQKKLQSIMTNVSIRVMNAARGGWSSRIFVFSFRTAIRSLPVIPDIVLLDFSVNDLTYFGQEADAQETVSSIGVFFDGMLTLLSQYAPAAAILMIAAPFGASVDQLKPYSGDIRNYYSIAAQRTLAVSNHHVALVDMYSASITTPWQPWNANASHYFLVHRLMAQFNWTFQMAFEKLQSSHPTWHVHEAMSEIIVDTLARLYRRSCSDDMSVVIDPEMGATSEEKNTICLTPITLIDANDPASSGWTLNTSTADGGWTFEEDRKGKPGWISTRRNASIAFELTFDRSLKVINSNYRSSMMLSVTYLRSFGSWGSAGIYFANEKSTGNHGSWTARSWWKQQLNAAWQNRFSANVVDVFYSDNDGFFKGNRSTNESIVGTFVVQHEGPEGSKFKLISISAC